MRGGLMAGCRHLRLHHVLGVAGLLAAALVLLRFRAITSQVAQAEHLIQVTQHIRRSLYSCSVALHYYLLCNTAIKSSLISVIRI